MTITQFRTDMFSLVEQAMSGKQVWVTYKGRRFRIAPESEPTGRLDRVVPLQIVNPDSPPDAQGFLRQEMQSAWEKD